MTAPATIQPRSSVDERWLEAHQRARKEDLLREMLAKFRRDNPRADAAAVADNEAQVRREIGLPPGLP